MKKFFIANEEIAESPEVKAPVTETELVVYCKVGYFEGLKEAVKKERQDQYEIKSSNDKNGSKGCVRIRKTVCSDGVSIVLTNKVRTEDSNLSISEEYNTDITQEHFDAFAKICSKKTIKDRFIFMVKNVSIGVTGESTSTIEVPELKFEVDVFLKEGGTYHEWCKIDIELDPLLKLMNESDMNITDFNLTINVSNLPFKPADAFVGSNATEEQNKILDYFYSEVFISDN